MKFGSTVATDGLNIRELFSQYFSTVYVKDSYVGTRNTHNEYNFSNTYISSTLFAILLNRRFALT